MDKPCTYWYFTQPTTVTPDGQQWPMTLEDYTFLKDQCMSVTYEDLVCHHHHIGYPVHVQIDNDCNDSSKSLTMNLEGDGTYLAFHTKRYTGKAAVIRVAHLGIGPGTHVHFLPGGCHEGLLVEWVEPLIHKKHSRSCQALLNLTIQKAQCVYQQFCAYKEKIEFLKCELERKLYPSSNTAVDLCLDFLKMIPDDLRKIIEDHEPNVKKKLKTMSVSELIDSIPLAVDYINGKKEE